MIVDLPATTTAAVNEKMVELRKSGGAVALGRVFTLVIVTVDGAVEAAIDAANQASSEHPCRILVVARGFAQAASRLDAQIRVGGDAGASEVVVFRLYGELASEGASVTVPLLLADAPMIAWWPGEAPEHPASSAIGGLAHRRITDAEASGDPQAALEQRRISHTPGDTDLAWTRLTNWRAALAASLDQRPAEEVTGATVTGGVDSPSATLLAGWLSAYLQVHAERVATDPGGGIASVTLQRPSGPVELRRMDNALGLLTQPDQPERRVALQRRDVPECLAEECRRLDEDEIFEVALHGLNQVKDAS